MSVVTALLAGVRRRLALSQPIIFHYRDQTNLNSFITTPDTYLQRFLRLIRLILFAVTSAFYLAYPPFSAMYMKLFVVFTMMVAAFLAQDLFDSWSCKIKEQQASILIPGEYPRNSYLFYLLALINIETIGIALLVLPTGGLESPFVWYVLNPIFIAAIFLPVYYCWVTLALFLTSAVGASALYPGITGSILSFALSHWDLLLVFSLSTALIQVATSLYRHLIKAYTALAAAHTAAEHSLNHIASLYQALEAISNPEDTSQLAGLLAAYTEKLCGKPAACLVTNYCEDEAKCEIPLLRVTESPHFSTAIDWEKEMNYLWDQKLKNQHIAVHVICDSESSLTTKPIIAHGECFGLLAFIHPLNEPGPQTADRIGALTFLADLGGIILERLKAEKLWGHLLVSEEQNRIANEIHDGVSQYLFSIVCALHTLTGPDGRIDDVKTLEQLSLIQETAHRASKELRASIYSLSPQKRGESVFMDSLALYLDELGRLNGIKVDLHADGSEEVLSPALRKSLYRIIREASSNAVRHGKCTYLQVRLMMSPASTVLEIEDNGCGCPPEIAVSNGQLGLGIRNMHQLTLNFNGQFHILSEPGQGTLIRCTFPKRIDYKEDSREAVGQ